MKSKTLNINADTQGKMEAIFSVSFSVGLRAIIYSLSDSTGRFVFNLQYNRGKKTVLEIITQISVNISILSKAQRRYFPVTQYVSCLLILMVIRHQGRARSETEINN